MKIQDITISYLAEWLEWVPVIAGWFYEQWYDLYVNKSMTLKDVENSIADRCNCDKIPLVLVAIDDDKVIGTIGLKQHDMDTRKDLSPWLAGLYVATEHRCNGVGSLLIEALIEKARALDISKLYLYTPEAEDFYRKLDWQALEQTEYLGRKVTILEKSF